MHVNIWNYWPLLLVLVGGRIVWQTTASERAGRQGDTPAVATVSAVAVMGGFDRKITSQEFRGGELTAFMGGGKLDLREPFQPAGRRSSTSFR